MWAFAIIMLMQSVKELSICIYIYILYFCCLRNQTQKLCGIHSADAETTTAEPAGKESRNQSEF